MSEKTSGESPVNPLPIAAAVYPTNEPFDASAETTTYSRSEAHDRLLSLGYTGGVAERFLNDAAHTLETMEPTSSAAKVLRAYLRNPLARRFIVFSVVGDGRLTYSVPDASITSLSPETKCDGGGMYDPTEGTSYEQRGEWIQCPGCPACKPGDVASDTWAPGKASGRCPHCDSGHMERRVVRALSGADPAPVMICIGGCGRSAAEVSR